MIKLAADTVTLDAPPSKVELDQGRMSASCIFAVDTVDRVGDQLSIQGINTANHRRNPLVLFNHKQDNLDDAVGMTQDPDGNYTVVLREHDAVQTSYFCQGNLLAEQLYDRIVAGQIKANSIGYRALKKTKNRFGGFDLLETELIECSWVLVGANADAIRSCLSRDLICGKSLHPALRAAYQAQVPAKSRVSVTGGYVMSKIAAKKLEATKKANEPETPAPAPVAEVPAPVEAAPAIPHGAQMLTAIHTQIAGILAFCDAQLPQLENEAVETKVLDACKGLLDSAADIEALFASEYPEVPALEAVAKVEETEEEPAETEEGKGEETTEEEGSQEGETTEKSDPPQDSKASGKSYSGDSKRLTKAMGNTIKECSDHLGEMKDAENLTSAQKLVCKHYHKELGALVEEKAEDHQDVGEVDEIEKEFDNLSPADQKLFIAELQVWNDKQEAAERRAALVN